MRTVRIELDQITEPLHILDEPGKVLMVIARASRNPRRSSRRERTLSSGTGLSAATRSGKTSSGLWQNGQRKLQDGV